MDKIAEISAPNNDNMVERLGWLPSNGHAGRKLLILPILIIVIITFLLLLLVYSDYFQGLYLVIIGQPLP